MHFFAVTAIILLFYIFYPHSKWEAAVILFVAFIPQGALLGEGQQFLGVIDHRSVVSLIVIYTAYNHKTLKSLKQDKYKLLALTMCIFIVTFLPRYIEIKDYILFGGFDILTLAKRTTRDLILAFVVYLILKRMYDYRTLKGLELGFLAGISLALISMIFYDFFLRLGFSMHIGFQYDTQVGQFRLTGFLGKDPNEASRFFNLVLAYILARLERKKIRTFDIVMVGLIMVGLFIFASKTGIFIASILILLYIYRASQKNIKKAFYQSIIVISMGLIMFNYFGNLFETRVEEQVTGEQDTYYSRQSYWVLYLNDLKENPEYLLLGNLGAPTYHRDVHNTYIWYLFYTGLINFSIIIFIFLKIFFLRKRYQSNFLYYNPVYPLVALMISWITGAGQLNYWFILIIGASAGIPPDYYKINTKFIDRLKLNV